MVKTASHINIEVRRADNSQSDLFRFEYIPSEFSFSSSDKLHVCVLYLNNAYYFRITDRASGKYDLYSSRVHAGQRFFVPADRLSQRDIEPLYMLGCIDKKCYDYNMQRIAEIKRVETAINKRSSLLEAASQCNITLTKGQMAKLDKYSSLNPS